MREPGGTGGVKGTAQLIAPHKEVTVIARGAKNLIFQIVRNPRRLCYRLEFPRGFNSCIKVSVESATMS